MMQNIADILGLPTLVLNKRIYHFQGNLDAYEKIFSLVLIQDTVERDQMIDDMKFNELRDLKVKLKISCNYENLALKQAIKHKINELNDGYYNF